LSGSLFQIRLTETIVFGLDISTLIEYNLYR